MGDLVEQDFSKSERESVVAVFVRRLGPVAQLLTHQGRWVHVSEKSILYSQPGFVPPELIQPIIKYLPDENDVKSMAKLMEEASMKDMSVPRSVSAPVVDRLLHFWNETKTVYRKNANALDNAHDLLAHGSDLRYGSLRSIASRLLDKPANKISPAALFTVRQALARFGFGFSFHIFSHRETGLLQIRSKIQTQLVATVRNWLRQWQEEQALLATMGENEKNKIVQSKGAAIVSSFIEKAKFIVEKSRKTRKPTPFGALGPSERNRNLEKTHSCVQVINRQEFTPEETSILRFFEYWCLSNLMWNTSRLNSLPPLVLQATGLYENHILNSQTGALFLKELGVIAPYDYGIRYDPHLLLPNSQDSRPLQALMQSIENPDNAQDLKDSMAGLRRDWGDLPVYCVDDASALEIDDGISIRKADEEGQYWVDIHIANPTAFFDRDHRLAKMARHMCESIYMPDMNYRMLPAWVAQDLFSLDKDRPCLTFSARMDQTGHILEHDITPGIVRNVKRITPAEVDEILGTKQNNKRDELVLTVGGTPPPPPERTSALDSLTPDDMNNFKTLSKVATGRMSIRHAAGGLFFEETPSSINVWEDKENYGVRLDMPTFKKSRTFLGDPIIEYRTTPTTNYFSAQPGEGKTVVREMMLLACEIAARWCEERAIPAIFRGSVARPDQADSETFFREVLAPAAAADPNGEYPIHLGFDYLKTFGVTGISTKPFMHRILGMPKYGKVTSPLRRYGDMILHWQIEAAIREESIHGKGSLKTDDPNAVRSFLPFSNEALESIKIGLPPRERAIMLAKRGAEQHWRLMLLFRMHYFGQGTSSHPPDEAARSIIPRQASIEGRLVPQNMTDLRAQFKQHPDSPLPRRMTALFMSAFYENLENIKFKCMLVELNTSAFMIGPTFIKSFEGSEKEVRAGDEWEVEIFSINVQALEVIVTPIRLINRVA
ncbi:Hypothetical protein R9X50_00455700 [Acrodontium crateriforme]|uniref:RNB domain-containing protein n=1 Tax=Acrodontium crateriforme TaxID=150365 RepID=A0AAQ3M5J7_9PEZI|nr:Hypothetical protein R9X50_00455700 [Acrodontium crateriforme]